MTFLEMQNEVIRRLDEDSVSQVFVSRQDVKEALNDGYEEISDTAEWLEKTETLTLDGSLYYDLSLKSVIDNYIVLTPKRFYNNQTSSWLRPRHVRDLDYYTAPRWETNTGEPQDWLIRGLLNLGLHPTQSSGTVKIQFAALPTELTNDNDTPEFPQEFHYALVDYALFSLFAEDGQSSRAARFWRKYQAVEGAFRHYVKKRLGLDRVASFKGDRNG